MYHTAAQDFNPTGALTEPAALTAALKAADIYFCTGLCKREMMGTEFYFGIFAEQLFCKLCNANAVIASPLLETSIAGAKRLLINITMSEDILSSDVDNATKMITDKAADNVEFIFGTAFKEDMQDEMTITVIAAGFDEEPDESEEAEESAAEEAAAPEEPEAQPQPQPQQTQAAANGGKKPADPDDLMAIFEILDRK